MPCSHPRLRNASCVSGATGGGSCKGHVQTLLRLRSCSPHPGEILRVDLLPCLDLTPSELAAHLGLPSGVVDGLLSERTSVTPDLAQRLGLALGQGPHYWLALQMQYDLWQVQRTQPDGVRPVTWRTGAGRRKRPFTGGAAAA